MSPPNHFRHLLTAIVVALLAALLVPTPGSADVVTLADGRTFEGTILDRTDDSVTIRTLVARAPVTLRLTITEEDSIQEKKVPSGFFEPRGTTIEPPSGPAPAGAEHLYLEVPIRGRIGEDTVAEGVRLALAHALREHVSHIAFTIDSAGGDPSEARGIFEVLEAYSPHLTYHAVVQRAEGVAMAVPIWCDTIHVRPDARLGAIETSDRIRSADDEGHVLSAEAIVARAAAVASSRGLPGLVLAAMVIPEETIEAWREEDGTVHIASVAPEDAAPERSILRNDEKSRLTLTGTQAAELGLAKAYEGTLDELGAKLEREGWTAESSYGTEVMERKARDARAEREKAERGIARMREDIEENVSEHRETMGYVLGSLAEYREYDPRRDEFETIVVDTGSIDWFGNYHYQPRDTGQFTKDAKQRWRMQTDLSLRALDRARKGLKQIEKLDGRGEKLGIVRDSDEELQQYIRIEGVSDGLTAKSLERRIVTEMERLARERNRKGN